MGDGKSSSGNTGQNGASGGGISGASGGGMRGADDGSSRGRTDGRALRFAIIFPVLLSAGLVVGGLMFAAQVPGGVVLPSGGGPLPLPTFLAVAVAVTLILGITVGSQGARTVLPRQLRRFLLGLAMMLQLSSVSLFAATLLGQTGQSGLPTLRVDGNVLAMGAGFALAMGVVLGMTFKPEEQWTSADDQALEAILAEEADPTAGSDRLSYAIHPRGTVVTMIVLLAVLPGAVLTILSPWFLLAFVVIGIVVIVALYATVQMDRNRLTVKLAAVVPVIVVPRTDVEVAVSMEIKAGDYGGWGLRKHAGNESFLASSGAAVIIRSTKAGRIVLGAPSMDTADALAAILNRRAG